MQQSLIQQGIELMFFGMGSVFVFLALLVICTTVMSNIVQKFVKPELVPAPRVKRSPAPTPAAPVDQQLLAVISEAIKQHRSR